MRPRRYLRHGPGSESAGYHGDLSIPGYKPKTPTKAPPPAYAPKGPAGDYAGAGHEYEQSVQALPAPVRSAVRKAARKGPYTVPTTAHAPPQLVAEIHDLLTPGPIAKEMADSAHRLGVKSTATNQIDKFLSALSSTAGTAVHQLAQGVQDASQSVKAAEKTIAKAPHEPANKVFGVKTLGAPTVAQVVQAARKGKVRHNKRGKLTIPATRAAAHKLSVAKKLVARTRHLSGPLTPGQRRFAQIVARETGLSPRVIAAQALAEESGPAAQKREAEGNHNWLNIGFFDSGPGALTRQSVWGDPDSAAHATAQFLKGQRFNASQGIRNILPAAQGQPDAVQIAAIANSGWATNPQYGSLLASTHQQVSGGQADPQAQTALRNAKAQASRLGIPTESPTRLEPLPKKTLTRFKAAVVAAHEIDKLKLPYIWGGGHGSPASSPTGGGLDCSGAVGYVLNKIGAMHGSAVSGDMGRFLEAGPGAITVFYNDEHTFMRIGNKYFGTSRTNPGGGAGFIDTSVAQQEAESGRYRVGHVPGLGKKVAVQMGVHVGAAGFPGMELSEDGTTAQIAPGAGGTRDKPGFSSEPIAASIAPVSPLLATSAPLPEAFSQFQLGQDPVAEQSSGHSVIDNILRGRRV